MGVTRDKNAMHHNRVLANHIHHIEQYVLMSYRRLRPVLLPGGWRCGCCHAADHPVCLMGLGLYAQPRLPVCPDLFDRDSCR